MNLRVLAFTGARIPRKGGLKAFKFVDAGSITRLLSASTAMPSGPLVPKKVPNTPTLEIEPSGSSGPRQTACSA
jgi:hypothetical protein